MKRRTVMYTELNKNVWYETNIQGFLWKFLEYNNLYSKVVVVLWKGMKDALTKIMRENWEWKRERDKKGYV